MIKKMFLLSNVIGLTLCSVAAPLETAKRSSSSSSDCDSSSSSSSSDCDYRALAQVLLRVQVLAHQVQIAIHRTLVDQVRSLLLLNEQFIEDSLQELNKNLSGTYRWS